MAEKAPKVYSLLALSQSIRNLINDKIGQQSFWLKAEIAQIKKAASGHYYLELVQERGGMRLASMQAVIWALDYDQILQKQGSEINALLKQGQELVLRVMVDYHPVFGLKLLIKDLDLNFVLGELEKRKRQTMEALKAAGFLELQKKLEEKIVWQRIAVFCSEEAAAYQDFIQHLKENEYGYRLQTDLYPVPVQGSAAADAMRKQLVKLPIEDYDMLAIIRGGGSALDLDCFNDEKLSKALAKFPLPVHSGIGHESDWTVLDMVAQKAHKTPTALADYLIDRMATFESDLKQMSELMHRRSMDCLKFEDQNLLRYYEVLQVLPSSQLQRQRGHIHNKAGLMVRLTADALREHDRSLNNFEMQLKDLSKHFIRRQKEQLEQSQKELNERGLKLMEKLQNDLSNLQQRLELLKPERTLERGYSITRKGSHSLRTVQGLQSGDQIKTQLKDGEIESTIIKVNKNE